MSSGFIFKAFEVKVKFLWLVSRCNFYLTQKHDSVFFCNDPESFRSECFDFPSNLNYYTKNHNLEINLFYFDFFWNLDLTENQNIRVLI